MDINEYRGKQLLQGLAAQMEPRYKLNKNADLSNLEFAVNSNRLANRMADDDMNPNHKTGFYFFAEDAPYADAATGANAGRYARLADNMDWYNTLQEWHPDSEVDNTPNPEGLLNAYVNNLYKKLQPVQRTNAEIGSSFMDYLNRR